MQQDKRIASLIPSPQPQNRLKPNVFIEQEKIPLIMVKLEWDKQQEVNNMRDEELLKRITYNPMIFGGKPVIRGMRIAVEHILGMLAAGSTTEELLEGYPYLEKEDILACLAYAHRMVAHERIEPALAAE